MFSFICAWTNAWVSILEAGDLRCHGAHYDVIVMKISNGWKHWHYWCNSRLIGCDDSDKKLTGLVGFQGVYIRVLKEFFDENRVHSVESPSMVDPQWDIWYWGSKWNLHTVCWSAVGCEWGTTSVYFGITYVCFVPSRLPVFAVEPQYLLQDFLFLSKVSFQGHIQNLQKNFMLV